MRSNQPGEAALAEQQRVGQCLHPQALFGSHAQLLQDVEPRQGNSARRPEVPVDQRNDTAVGAEKLQPGLQEQRGFGLFRHLRRPPSVTLSGRTGDVSFSMLKRSRCRMIRWGSPRFVLGSPGSGRRKRVSPPRVPPRLVAPSLFMTHRVTPPWAPHTTNHLPANYSTCNIYICNCCLGVAFLHRAPYNVPKTTVVYATVVLDAGLLPAAARAAGGRRQELAARDGRPSAGLPHVLAAPRAAWGQGRWRRRHEIKPSEEAAR